MTGTLLLLLTLGAAGAQTASELPDHALFTEVLREAVVFPRVDYARLQEHRAPLDRYLRELAETAPSDVEAASRREQLAFWINAYNACMLRLVLDHYPIRRSAVGIVQGARNFLARRPADSVWWIRDVFGGEFCPVAGADRSLDEIEHEIIRPRFEEPRIHFAVNCAALSCPPLWPEAYLPHRLEEQLRRATAHVMSDPAHFRLEGDSPTVLRVNRVLDWFGEDFGGEEGIKSFFGERTEGETRSRILAPETRVEFFDYDWTLNDVDR